MAKKVDAKENKTKLTVVKDGVEEVKTVNKPTPEETEQYKNDFLEAQKTFENTVWEISEPGQFGANDVALYLFDFMHKYAFWSQTSWMGLMKMEEAIKKSLGNVSENVGLRFGYQALEYCGYMLSNPGGVGLEAAKEFEKQADKYVKIVTVVGERIEAARNKLKEVQYLQEKWAAAEQGFHLSELEPKEEEKPKEEPENIGEIQVDLSDAAPEN